MYKVTYQIFFGQQKYTQALRVALKMHDGDLVEKLFSTVEDSAIRKQMAFILGPCDRPRSGFEAVGHVSVVPAGRVLVTLCVPPVDRFLLIFQRRFLRGLIAVCPRATTKNRAAAGVHHPDR